MTRSTPTAVLARHGSVYAGGMIVQAITAAIALPFVTRLVPPGEFGRIAVALIVTNLLGVSVDLGLARAVLRVHFLGPEGRARSGGLAIATLAVAVVLVAGIDLTGPVWARGFAAIEYDALMRLAVWGGAAVAVRNAVQAALRARQQVVGYLAVTLGSTAGAQVLGLVLLWQTGGRTTSYVAGLSLGAAVAAVGGLVAVRPTVRPLGDRDLLRWAAGYALPIVPAEVAAVAIWFVDRVVIERLLDLDAVGRYQLAYTLGSAALGLVMAVSQAWAPLVHAAGATHRLDVTARTRTAVAELAGYLVVGLALVAPFALQVLAPDAYRPTALVAVSVVVALAVLPLVTQQAATHLITDAGQTAPLSRVGVGAVVANVALTVGLVPVWGLQGAAVATLTTYLLHGLLLARIARRVTGGFPSPVVRPWAIAIAGGATGILLPFDGVWAAVRLLAALVVAGLVLRLGRGLLRTDDRPDPAIPSEAMP